MRFLHIADLHLGKKLYEAPLIDDQRHILHQLTELAAAERVTAVLVAGDVYDRAVPPAEAVQLLDGFLTGLAARDIPVVLIGGNHDSAERLAFGARLMASRQVYIAPPFDAAHTAIAPLRFNDEHGEAYVWPLPFIKPAHVRATLPEAEAGTYTQAVASVLGALPLDTAQRNVLVCHQYLTGAERAESEEAPVGGLDNVDAAVMAAFDYVALGHLHRAQRVGRDTVRYAGSPLAYAFSEAGEPKSATLVTLGRKGETAVRAVPLMPLRQLRALRGRYDELALRKNYEGTCLTDYLAVTLTDETDVPDALAKLQSIYPNLLRLTYDNARTRAVGAAGAPQPDGQRAPLMLLHDFYALQNGAPIGPQASAYALTLLQKAWEGEV